MPGEHEMKEAEMKDSDTVQPDKADEYPPFENDESIMDKIDAALKLRETEGRSVAIERLLSLERTNRGAGASPETSAVCVSVVRMLGRDERDWKAMGEYVVMLSKRRAQLKMAIQRMVKEAMRLMEELLTDEETTIQLLETLRDVTAGKIFVELERARLTRKLSNIKVKDGKLEEAAKMMQEVQVETFGGMQQEEKFDFILEQVRLCLETNDYIRAGIIAKKIMPRQVNKPHLKPIKMRYYATMIRIHVHHEDYINMCISYLERFHTVVNAKTEDSKDTSANGTTIDDNAKVNGEASTADATATADMTEDAWVRELKLACMFILLSPYDNQQVDLLERIKAVKQTSQSEHLARFNDLLGKMSTLELISWPNLMREYEATLKDVVALSASEVMSTTTVEWKKALQQRVTEHNLRVLAKYYSRIHMKRLAELLDMSEDETERKLAAMVSDKKAIWAKIDRPNRIVSFAKPQDADSVLNDWADNVASLLDIVEKTCHLVHRETMVHALDGANGTSTATTANGST